MFNYKNITNWLSFSRGQENVEAFMMIIAHI